MWHSSASAADKGAVEPFRWYSLKFNRIHQVSSMCSSN